MSQESLFTKIIRGDIPSHKIYEDDKTFAFLDIHPVQPGHTLVVPKNQIDNLWELPEEDYSSLMVVCKKIASHVQAVLGKRVGVQVLGIDVPHAHVHLIPFAGANEFRNVPDMNAEPDHNALKQMADKLKLEES